MSKRRFNSAIEYLKSCFETDEESLEILARLEKNGQNISFSEEVTSDGSFPVPLEIEGKAQGFALFSDGACRGNPGPGAWGMMAQDSDGEVLFEGSGVSVNTTNNKMEMEGALRALEDLLQFFIDSNYEGEPEVYLYSDSKYVVDGMTSWLSNWKKRGWKTASKKSPENLELWQELDRVQAEFPEVHYRWVKGHAGHPQNEHCDQLANQALDDSGF